MLCGVCGVVFALLRWSFWGPVEVTNRLIGALVNRGAITSEEPAEARAELRAYLEKLAPSEQRRFVYEVARHTFGGTDLSCWDEPVTGFSLWNETVTDLYVGEEGAGKHFEVTGAALEQIFDNDHSTLQVVTVGAVACARHIPSLHYAAARARAWLSAPGGNYVPALAELLAGEGRILRVTPGIPDQHKVALEDWWRSVSAVCEEQS